MNIKPQKCWLCDKVDNLTAEHHYKKSEVKRQVKFPFNAIKTFHDSRPAKSLVVQGPDSNLLKFNPSLCAKCNNEKTQEIDNVFSDFNQSLRINDFNEDILTQINELPWIFNESDPICFLEQHSPYFGYTGAWISLNKLKNKDKGLFHPKISQINAYFAKLLGCSLTDSNEMVPKEIKSIVKQQNPKKLKSKVDCYLFLLKTPFNLMFYPYWMAMPNYTSDGYSKTIVYSLMMQLNPNQAYLFIVNLKKPSKEIFKHIEYMFKTD